VIKKIISGGQTGVDRAALEVADALQIPCGGWCPKGRKAEDGPIEKKYPLKETPSDEYPERTEWNVRDSDGTLIIYRGSLAGGSALTKDFTKKYGKPCFTVNLLAGPVVKLVQNWIENTGVEVLNVAGPRESANTGIHDQAKEFLTKLLKRG